MIQSAQVFSPRPSSDPRQNLRVLQSPLKPFKLATPSRSHYSPQQTEEDVNLREEEVILVQGAHPRVVEEDRDLVILEDVDTPPAPPQTPSPGSRNHSTPQTPRPKTPKPSLHKLVLLRSAQRAVIKAEEEKEEDEEEEKEVFGSILVNDESDSGDSDEDEENVYEEPFTEQTEPTQPSSWRKSLERLWLFGSAKDDSTDVKEEEDTVNSTTICSIARL